MWNDRWVDALVLFGQYVEWLRLHVPHAYANLAPGATDGELAELERGIGRQLPDDVRAVLRLHNGQRLTMTATTWDWATPCIPTASFLSTSAILEIWREWEEVRHSPDVTLEELQEIGGVLPSAAGVVKPLYTTPDWIPLWADTTSADYIGLDFDPDAGGVPGQIINFGRDENYHFLIARNFTELLRILVEDVVDLGRWEASVEERDGELLHGFGNQQELIFNVLRKRFG